jgi:uncharacterized membrane protein
MSPLARLVQTLDAMRARVPGSARWIVAAAGAALAAATFAPALLPLAGLEVPRWEAFVHGACGPFCHQIPSRSLHVAGHALPLCARCTGMWLGITLGTSAAVLLARRRRFVAGLVLALAATALSGLDHLREQAGQQDWPLARFAFGLAIFAGVTQAVALDALAALCALGRALAGRIRACR